MGAFRAYGVAASVALLAASAGGCSTLKSYAGFKQPSARCETLQFPIYFQTGSDALTDPARQMIATTAKQAKACKVAQIQVIGLADADGSAARNMELSRQRAQVVASALAAEGLPAPSFMDAGGEGGATTVRGAAEPGRRRTEVVITFTP